MELPAVMGGRWSYLQSWEVCGWSYLQCLVSVHSRLPSLAQSLAMCREKTTRQFQSSVMASCNLNRQTYRQADRQTKRNHRGKGKVEVKQLCVEGLVVMSYTAQHSTTAPHVSKHNFHQKNDFHLPLATRQQTNHI